MALKLFQRCGKFVLSNIYWLLNLALIYAQTCVNWLFPSYRKKEANASSSIPKHLLQRMWSAAFFPVQQVQSCWYFRPSFVFCTLPSLWFNSPPPFPKWKSTGMDLCMYTGCNRGVGGLRQINPYRKVPLDDDILHCLLWHLSFYGFPTCRWIG